LTKVDESSTFCAMSETAFTTAAATSSDEALLDSLFSRLSPSPESLLRAALRFAGQHPGEVSSRVLVDALVKRGNQQALGWIGKLEPTIGTREVMLQTGLSKSGVHKAKDENRLFAFRLEGHNADRFPLIQFRAGKVRDWVPQLLAIVGNGLSAADFLAVERKRLDGQSYIDLLSEGDDESAIAAMLKHASNIGNEALGPDPATKRVRE
jgi:hypothetical protein